MAANYSLQTRRPLTGCGLGGLRPELKRWVPQERSIIDGAIQFSGSELDRFEAYPGYVESNVRLVHHECPIQDQASKGYA